MDQLKPWIERDVLEQLRRLKLKSLKTPSQGDFVDESGELRLSQDPSNHVLVLRIAKIEPPSILGLQAQFIPGELSDTRSLIKCEFAYSCAYKRSITEQSVGKVIQLTEYDLVVKGSDGLLFWRDYTSQKQSTDFKASRGQDGLPVTSDLNKFLATPEPIFRIHRFKFIQSEFPIDGSPSSILESGEIKELLNSFPSKSIFTESCKSNDTDNNSDGDATEIRSQVFPTPKKKSAQNRSFLEFDENISQAEFVTQAGQNALQNEMVSSQSLGGFYDGKKRTMRSCESSQDTTLLLPLSRVLCSHPGWEGMMRVTKFDVTIPKDQLAALEIESAWYPREEHLSTHFEDTLVRYPRQTEPVLQCSPSWTLGDPIASEAGLPWSPSPPPPNFMPPDSSALQPPETPILETIAYKGSQQSNPSCSGLGREPHTPSNSDQYHLSAIKKNRSCKTAVQSTEDGRVELGSPTSLEDPDSPQSPYANPEFEEFSREEQVARKAVPWKGAQDGVSTYTGSTFQCASSYAGSVLNQFVSSKSPTPNRQPLSQRSISDKKHVPKKMLTPQQTTSSSEDQKTGEISSFSKLDTVEKPNYRSVIQNGPYNGHTNNESKSHEEMQESTLFSSEGMPNIDSDRSQSREQSVLKSPGGSFELSATQFVTSLSSEEGSLPCSPTASQLIVERPGPKVTTLNPSLLPTAEESDDEEIPHKAPIPFLPRRTSYTAVTTKCSKQLVDPSTLLKVTFEGNIGRRQRTVGDENFTEDVFSSIRGPTVVASPNHMENINDNTCMMNTSKPQSNTSTLPSKTSEFPSTTALKQDKVEVTPYPRSKTVTQGETYSGSSKLNHPSCDTSPELPSDSEIIPGTTSDSEPHPQFATHKQGLSQRINSQVYRPETGPIRPLHSLLSEQQHSSTQYTSAGISSSFKAFAVVVPVHKGAKRKHEQVVRNQQKKLHVRKLGFSSQEREYKDINQLVQEHKRKYIENLSTSEECTEGESIPPIMDKVIQAVDSVEPQAITLPREAKAPILSNIGGPSESFDHIKRHGKSAQECLSSTQKALKTLLAERERDSLSPCSNITHPLAPKNYCSAAPASLVSRSPQSHIRQMSHRSSLPRQPYSSLHGTTLGSHTLVLQASDDTESLDTEDVITAKPVQQKQAQNTLIPASLSTVSHCEIVEKVINYAGIQGQDIDILIPGYNSKSEFAKGKLKDMRKTYFGRGDIAVQTPEEMEIEEEERQAKLARLKERAMSSRNKPWWDDGDTPIAQYDKKLGALLSVRRALEEKGGGVTRVELERLKSGDIVSNLQKL